MSASSLALRVAEARLSGTPTFSDALDTTFAVRDQAFQSALQQATDRTPASSRGASPAAASLDSSVTYRSVSRATRDEQRERATSSERSEPTDAADRTTREVSHDSKTSAKGSSRAPRTSREEIASRSRTGRSERATREPINTPSSSDTASGPVASEVDTGRVVGTEGLGKADLRVADATAAAADVSPTPEATTILSIIAVPPDPLSPPLSESGLPAALLAPNGDVPPGATTSSFPSVGTLDSGREGTADSVKAEPHPSEGFAALGTRSDLSGSSVPGAGIGGEAADSSSASTTMEDGAATEPTLADLLRTSMPLQRGKEAEGVDSVPRPVTNCVDAGAPDLRPVTSLAETVAPALGSVTGLADGGSPALEGATEVAALKEGALSPTSAPDAESLASSVVRFSPFAMVATGSAAMSRASAHELRDGSRSAPVRGQGEATASRGLVPIIFTTFSALDSPKTSPASALLESAGTGTGMSPTPASPQVSVSGSLTAAQSVEKALNVEMGVRSDAAPLNAEDGLISQENAWTVTEGADGSSFTPSSGVAHAVAPSVVDSGAKPPVGGGREPGVVLQAGNAAALSLSPIVVPVASASPVSSVPGGLPSEGERSATGKSAAPVVPTAPDPEVSTALGGTSTRSVGSYEFAKHLASAQNGTWTSREAARVTEQVAVRLHRAAQDGTDRVTLQLRPMDLGRIEVRLTFAQEGQGVQATILADHQSTLDLLTKDSSSLQRALQDAGFQTDAGSLNFGLRGDGNSQQSAFFAGTQDHSSTPGASSVLSPGLEEGIEDVAPPVEPVSLTSERVNFRV